MTSTVEETPDPELPANGELDRALNGPYAATPAALSMTQTEIEAAITAGRDSWSETTNSGGIIPLHQPLISAMIIAARFAAPLSNDGVMREITAPCAFTLLAIPDRIVRKAA